MAYAHQKSQVSLRTVFTVCFGVAAVVGLAVFAVLTRYAIALTLLAMLTSVALNHGVTALTELRVPRALAITIVLTLLLTAIVLIALVLFPPLAEQAKELMQQAPQFLKKLRNSKVFSTLRAAFPQGNEGLPSPDPTSGQQLVQSAARPVLSALGTALTGVTGIVTLFFLTVFMLLFGGKSIQRGVELLRPERRAAALGVLEKIYRSVGGYIVGLMLICTTNAALTTAFLALVKIPYFLPLGIISGFSSLVPYAGPLIAGAVITLFAAASASAWQALAIAVYFILYGQLEGHVLGPLVYRRTAHINPLLTLLSVLFFAELAGIIGAILAVPIVVVLQEVGAAILAFWRLREEERLPLQPVAPLGTSDEISATAHRASGDKFAG
jgi:predicted PurR-regulated permease PerM